MSLRIVITDAFVSTAEWVDALSALLPDARVRALDASRDGEADKTRMPTDGSTSTGRHATAIHPAGADDPWDPAAVDYAIGWNPGTDFFRAHQGLRAFFTMSAGVDRLLRTPGLPPQLPIVRLEDGGMAIQMAEYCLYEAIRQQRRFGEYDAQAGQRIWRRKRIEEKQAWPIGVFGLGAIGAPIARTLAQAGFPVRGYARSSKQLAGIECFDDRHGLQTFLSGARILVIVAPRTADTEGLFDGERLRWLPEGAWLINIARGALVDEPALQAAIDDGHLSGATLDVFATEPLPESHPFWQHPHIRITPHISGITPIAESARQIADKILALEHGKTVTGTVDRGRGY